MKIKKIIYILFLMALIFSLTDCGQKGDLVRPQSQEQQKK
jgi:predicted small lipoprotein YifL